MVKHSEESSTTVMSGISLLQDDKNITGIGRPLCTVCLTANNEIGRRLNFITELGPRMHTHTHACNHTHKRPKDQWTHSSSPSSKLHAHIKAL